MLHEMNMTLMHAVDMGHCPSMRLHWSCTEVGWGGVGEDTTHTGKHADAQFQPVTEYYSGRCCSLSISFQYTKCPQNQHWSIPPFGEGGGEWGTLPLPKYCHLPTASPKSYANISAIRLPINYSHTAHQEQTYGEM